MARVSRSVALVAALALCAFVPCRPAGATRADGLSVWVPQNQVWNSLGVTRSLYYVRDDVVQKHAAHFSLPVEDSTNQVQVSWQFVGPGPAPAYRIQVETSHPDMLVKPQTNISASGTIPTSSSGWSLRLRCRESRRKKEDVIIKVTITIRIEASSRPERVIQIYRGKTCKASKQDPFPRDMEPRVPLQKPPHRLFLAVVSGAVLVFVIAATAVAIFHIRRNRLMKKLHPPSTSPQPPTTGYAPVATQDVQEMAHFPQPGVIAPAVPPPQQQIVPGHMEMTYRHHAPPPNEPPPPLPNTGLRTDATLFADAGSRVKDWVASQQQQTAQTHPAHNPPAPVVIDHDEVMRTLEVDLHRLSLGQLLQEGTFGRVYQGILLTNAGEHVDVYVKTVAEGSSHTQSQILIKDATALYGMKHDHIQTLIATSWEGTRPMLMFPALSDGNLKRWLQSHKQTGLSTHLVVALGLQLCKGLQYLHRRKIIHKDIATRNCFLQSLHNGGYSMKLADAALARDLFSSDYHCLGDNENRPLKWMPIEAIAQKKYSKASDVWSMGVFLWELMTRAQQPFSDIDPFEMEAYLREGYRLHQPQNCPDQLYSILVNCWHARPQERSSLNVLYGHMQTLQRELAQYV